MTDTTDLNEPAFPISSVAYHQFCGLSMLDHFAGLSMQALIADPLRADQSREECARLSYLMATAMISERKAHP